MPQVNRYLVPLALIVVIAAAVVLVIHGPLWPGKVARAEVPVLDLGSVKAASFGMDDNTKEVPDFKVYGDKWANRHDVAMAGHNVKLISARDHTLALIAEKQLLLLVDAPDDQTAIQLLAHELSLKTGVVAHP
jgi:hypothetical protein